MHIAIDFWPTTIEQQIVVENPPKNAITFLE